MNLKNPPIRAMITPLALSVAAFLIVWALYGSGILLSVQSVLLFSGERAAHFTTLPRWAAALLILMGGLGAGVGVARARGLRSVFIVGGVIASWVILEIIASRLFEVDVLAAPSLLAAFFAAVFVQIWKLWKVDVTLTRNIRQAASKVGSLEGAGADLRLMSGLKLLETVLPLEEAVIFTPDVSGKLAPSARLRSRETPSDGKRNAAWREGVNLCEKAIATGGIVTAANVDNVKGEEKCPQSVALPLRHNDINLGALLLRLDDVFDAKDERLITAVGAQLARNLQRDEARKNVSERDFLSLFSSSAAAGRLELFGVLSGLLVEQKFGADLLVDTSDGHAAAYLDGTIACLNPAMLHWAQLKPAKAAGLDLFGLLDCFRTAVFDEPSIAVRRVLQTGESYEGELFFPDRDKTLELRIALVTTQKSDEANPEPRAPTCFAIAVRDVTDIKEHEKLKSDMVSLMSHELRTPITSINGFAELLSTDETLPAQAREFLGIITSESQRLSRMINTFLSVTHLEAADRQEILKIPLKLDDIVRETLVNLRPVAKKKRIRLIEQPTDRIPPVAADKGLIRQVVTNLVGNAIKYSPERTVVTIATELQADSVRFSVEDRGYGIPPESVDRVWEKFYRVARDGQEKDEESTGLGLAFVREVVEQHGGSVELESEVGRGSKFSFTLPRL